MDSKLVTERFMSLENYHMYGTINYVCLILF